MPRLEQEQLEMTEIHSKSTSTTTGASGSGNIQIVAGKRGDIKTVLGPYFEENKRSKAKSVTRKLVIVASAFTFLGGIRALSKMRLVPEGYVGISINNGRPELYGPGRHTMLSFLNGNLELFSLTQAQINKSIIHIITVKDEQFGLAWEQGEPMLLGPGVHIRQSPYFQFDKFVSQFTPVISHGSIHRIIIKEGERGIAWDGNLPIILKPGIHSKQNALFHFVKAVAINQQLVDLKPFSIITVRDGEVGISFDKGKLVVLQPQEHWLNAEKNQEFLGMLPTTEQVRELKPLEILTSDGLMVKIKGSISFKIINPKLAVTNIGASRRKANDPIGPAIFETIMRRANDTLAGLLTGTDILSAAQLGFSPAAVSLPAMENTDEEEEKTKGKKKEHEEVIYSQKERHQMQLNKMISEQFKSMLTTALSHEWGVELRDMSIIDINVMDKDVRNALAEGVRGNIEAATNRRNAESNAETARIEAAGKRDAAKYHADGEAYSVTTLATAQQKAGKLLEQTPIAVEIRLVEEAAKALSAGGNNLIIAPNSSAATMLQLIGASSRFFKTQKPPTPITVNSAKTSSSSSTPLNLHL